MVPGPSGALGVPDCWSGVTFSEARTANDRAAVVIAAACMHADAGVREACMAVIEDSIGRGSLARAVESVQEALAPFADDLLEPMRLEAPDFLAIAAVQCLRSGKRDSRTPLRISSPDALDLCGGVDLLGVRSARAVPRWTVHRTPNFPEGSAYHPDLLREWVSDVRTPWTSPVESASVGRRAELRIPAGSSGMSAFRRCAGEALGPAVPAVYRTLWFGHQGAADHVTITRSIEASLQRHARVIPKGTSVSALGGLFALEDDHVAVRFTTPESIMRLTVVASEPGAVPLMAMDRLWGWIVLGAGEDAIRFVRSGHAIPARWMQSSRAAIMHVPPELGATLAAWAGPVAGFPVPELPEPPA